MSDATALIIAIAALYSTHHWIGASVLVIPLGLDIFSEIDDPTGVKAAIKHLRGIPR